MVNFITSCIIMTHACCKETTNLNYQIDMNEKNVSTSVEISLIKNTCGHAMGNEYKNYLSYLLSRK